MNFGFSDSQILLREQVLRFLNEKAALPANRLIMANPQGFDQDLWQEMAALGWLGLLVDEQYGGVGLSWVDFLVLLEEIGRVLHPSPLIEHVLASYAVQQWASLLQKQKYLPTLAQGSQIATLAIVADPSLPTIDRLGIVAETYHSEKNSDFLLRGEKAFIAHPDASHLLLTAFQDDGGQYYLALIDKSAPGLKWEQTLIVDQSKPVGRFLFDQVRVSSDQIIAVDGRALQKLIDCTTLAMTAELIGSCERALEITVNYANQREQFGSLIGRYQGVKHRLAEMYVDIESFKSLVYYAVWCVDEAEAELARFVSLAKGYAAKVVAAIGIDSIQLHGAIGFTAEYDIQLYFKRSKWARVMYGDSDFHFERVASLGDS